MDGIEEALVFWKQRWTRFTSVMWAVSSELLLKLFKDFLNFSARCKA